MDRREWLSDNEEAFRTAFDSLQGNMWTAMPCIVVDVDLTRQTISAQSTIKGEFRDKEGEISSIEMPLFQDVLLCFPKGGGYIITFPVQPGDEVLIVFASRCIDSWFESGGENNVATEFRMHDLSDGFAILAPTSQPKSVANISTDSLRIMSENSNRYIEITNNDINIQSMQDVNFNVTRDLSITAGRDVNITAVRNINLSTTGVAADIHLESGRSLEILCGTDMDIEAGRDFILLSARDLRLDAGRDLQFMVANNATYAISQEMDVTVGTTIDLHVPTIDLNGATVVP